MAKKLGLEWWHPIALVIMLVVGLLVINVANGNIVSTATAGEAIEDSGYSFEGLYERTFVNEGTGVTSITNWRVSAENSRPVCPQYRDGMKLVECFTFPDSPLPD
ncbi:MAG: hypothetical protein ACOZAO_04900 [Patescibacteria group bacterium]